MPSDRRPLEDAFLKRAASERADGSEERKEITALDSFREWLSDNLRYLMLIAAILIVLAALFFGVRAMTRSLDGESGKAAGDRPVTESTVSAESRGKQDSPRRAKKLPRRAGKPSRRAKKPPRRAKKPPRRAKKPPRRAKKPPRRARLPRRAGKPPRRAKRLPRRAKKPPRRAKLPKRAGLPLRRNPGRMPRIS